MVDDVSMLLKLGSHRDRSTLSDRWLHNSVARTRQKSITVHCNTDRRYRRLLIAASKSLFCRGEPSSRSDEGRGTEEAGEGVLPSLGRRISFNSHVEEIMDGHEEGDQGVFGREEGRRLGGVDCVCDIVERQIGKKTKR